MTTGRRSTPSRMVKLLKNWIILNYFDFNIGGSWLKPLLTHGLYNSSTPLSFARKSIIQYNFPKTPNPLLTPKMGKRHNIGITTWDQPKAPNFHSSPVAFFASIVIYHPKIVFFLTVSHQLCHFLSYSISFHTKGNKLRKKETGYRSWSKLFPARSLMSVDHCRRWRKEPFS